MRLWSISAEYLDTKGLLALWREGLLAKAVLLGKTKGYKFHPQLERFKNYQNPIEAIDSFLSYVYLEATNRGYNFDKTKINFLFKTRIIKVKYGQICFEFNHLLKKLISRDVIRYNLIKDIKPLNIKPNPVFEILYGVNEIESWEKI